MEGEIKISNEKDVNDLAKQIIQKALTLKKEGVVVVALQGELGAGKTTLTKSIIRELGSWDVVSSPTFTICKKYKLPENSIFSFVFHFDLYRLIDDSDLENIGWLEALKTPESIVIVEWPERVLGAIPKNAIWVNLEHGNNQDERIARVS